MGETHGRTGGLAGAFEGIERPDALRDAILQTLRSLVVVLDPEGRIVLFNRACEEASGWTADEVRGRAVWDFLLLPEEAPGVRKAFDDLRAGDFPSRHENHWVARDGTRRRIAWNSTCVTDEEGRVRYVVGTGVDVTERQQARDALEESEAWNDAVLDAALDGIITIDSRGTIQSLNDAVRRLFGYEPEELVGRNVSTLMPAPFREEHDAYIERYLRTGERRIIGIGREVMGRRKDGTTFPLHLSVSEVRLGDRVRFAGILHDLTEQKRLQEELTRSQTLAAIGEMSASLAHEIKNPLAGISAAMQNLKTRLPGDHSSRPVLEEVLRQVERLDATVRHLLMFSRSWNPRRRVFDLREVVDRVVEATEGVPEFRGVAFRVEGGPDVPASVDRPMVEQVVLNLFYNAAQAMPEGGAIAVRLSTGSGGVVVEVADEGSGIPPEVMQALFKPFFTTKSRGTGLGLVNCLKIMEAHGGAISIDSAPGRGTRVTLRFPRPEAVA